MLEQQGGGAGEEQEEKAREKRMRRNDGRKRLGKAEEATATRQGPAIERFQATEGWPW